MKTTEEVSHRLKKGLLLLYVFLLFTQGTFAEDISRWHLPEGANARLRKGAALDIAYSPDGRCLAVVSSIGIWLYETTCYREVALFPEHTTWIKFSPDGTTLAGVTGETTIGLWDAQTGETQHTLKHKGAVTSMAFGPDSTTLVTGHANDINIIEDYDITYESTLTIYDVKTGLHTQTLSGHTDLVNSVAFSRDGKRLATGTDDGILRLWDANAGILKHTLTGHTSRIYSIAFSPDGKTIATGSGDGTVLLWEVPVTGDR